MNLRYTLRLEVRDCAGSLVGVREINVPVSASTAQEAGAPADAEMG